MAKTLVQYALKNGTQDNVSVLVLKFKWFISEKKCISNLEDLFFLLILMYYG